VPSPSCAWDVLTYKICKLREPQRTQLTKSLNFAQEKKGTQDFFFRA
jgi:hypothetical protein